MCEQFVACATRPFRLGELWELTERLERFGIAGFGWGATVGVGYDHYVSDEWSLGGIVRVTMYQLYGVDDSLRLIAPAALITLTRH